MAKNREKVLTIAGFDPSGGAGILADIKTFEQHKCLGFAIQTSFTIQNEEELEEVFWHANSKIEAQFKILASKHVVETIKIGITKDYNQLNSIFNWCEEYFKTAKIIWDPIIKSSSGFTFLSPEDILKIDFNKVDWITPNWEEAKVLFQEIEDEKLLETIQSKIKDTKILLKGGHNPTDLGKDYLIEQNAIYPFNPKKSDKIKAKHGSGCILSASITSLLAKKYPKIKTVLKAKSYTFNCLTSNPTLLAYHKKG